MRIANTAAAGRLYRLLLATLYTTFFLGTTLATSSADARSVTYDLDIPAEPLNDALQTFALASHHRLLYSAELVVGKRSPALKGQFTAEQAVARLLSSTNLNYEVTSDGLVLIRAEDTAPAISGDDANPANSSAQEGKKSSSGQFRLAQANSGSAQSVSTVANANPNIENNQNEAEPALAAIIVTAQKRAQDILSVPISITAISGASLEQQNIKNIDDLSRIEPGVSLIPASQAAGAGKAIYEATGDREVVIRGIASLAGSATTGVYLDDTPIAGREVGTIFPSVFDLERIEVLRGPQGTLFGAGSEGGTVRYITPTPSLIDSGGYAHAETAFTEHGAPSYEVGAAGGGPIVDDRIGIRGSLWTRYDGGYIDRYNFFTGEQIAKNTNSRDSFVGRLSMLTKLSDRLSVTTSLFAQEIDRADTDFWWEAKGTYQSYYSIPQPSEDRFYLPSASINYDFDSFSVKSITSYFSRYASGDNQIFHSYLQQLFYPQEPNYALDVVLRRHQDNFTQELRFTSTGDGPLNWVGGIYFANNREASYVPEVEPLANALEIAVFGKTIEQRFGSAPLGPTENIMSIDNRVIKEEELAEFLDTTFKITDRFKITAGVRVSTTEFDFDELVNGPLEVGASKVPLITTGGSTQHPVAPKAGLSYDLEGGGVVYATYAKGFRVGGENAAFPILCDAQLATLHLGSKAPQYGSDSVKSYEIGAKMRLLNNKLLLSGSAYWIDWADIQANVLLNSCASSYTTNFGTAVSKGFDLQALYAPIGGLELSGSAGMTNAYYTESVLAPSSKTNFLAKNGEPIVDTPKWRAALGASYSWRVAGDMTTYTRADWTYSGNYYRTPPEGVSGYLASIRDGDSIATAQVRAGLRNAGNGWDLAFFVKNLTDNHTPIAADAGTVPNTYGFTAIRVATLQPRTYGVAFTYKFGM